MTSTHYVPKPAGGDQYGFTSPIGTHGPQWTREKCVEVIARIRERHVERSKGDGHEAAMLANYFDQEGTLPPPEEPKKAMEAFPCTGNQRKHDWVYNGTTGFWCCSACHTDKRDFERAYRERTLFTVRENYRKTNLRKSC